MANPKKPSSDKETGSGATKDINGKDFQFVFSQLLAAYQPVLEEELRQTKAPEAPKKEAESVSRECENELARANRIFDKFMTEEVALRLLPEEGREQVGPIENWKWCLAHIRCCIVFGWLVCRGPRTFRALAYYAYIYWLCIRKSLGNPVANPPTDEQRKDFQVLVKALASAYKPYLTDQLASVEFPDGLPDEILNGKIDCLEGQADICAIFDRLLTTDAAKALTGDAARSQDQGAWFCRCWCMCSMCFGCCLAKVRDIDDLRRCLSYYFRCLENCFQSLSCALTYPTGCVEETEFPEVGIFRGVEILGTATGFSCNHYILQWRQNGIGPWQSGGIVYPGGASQGACGVVDGLLGYLSTFPFVSGGLVEIQLCVYSSDPAVAPCCVTIDFQLQRNLVWIEGVEGVEPATPPGIFDPTAQLVNGSGVVQSFGTALEIDGSAMVGGCDGRTILKYTLSYQQGFTTSTSGSWVQFWQVNYNTPLETTSAGFNTLFNTVLTNLWSEFDWWDPFPLPGHCAVLANQLGAAYWDSQNPQGPYAVQYPDPPVSCGEAPSSTWNSTPLALPNCQSGQYTLRLTVTDTALNTTDSLRQVWFDNKQIYGTISQIGSIAACATIGLSEFAVGSGDCTVPWPAPLEGVAYDEYILEGNLSTPSDNFGGYSLSILKAGGGWHALTIPGPGSSPWPGPYVGTSRVGDPGVRCASAVPPPGPIPPFTNGILALIDMRRLDSVCNTNPGDSDLVLQRATISPSGALLTPGQCCGFIISLSVWDNSICPSLSGGRHEANVSFPFCICNDLPPVVVGS